MSDSNQGSPVSAVKNGVQLGGLLVLLVLIIGAIDQTAGMPRSMTRQAAQAVTGGACETVSQVTGGGVVVERPATKQEKEACISAKCWDQADGGGKCMPAKSAQGLSGGAGGLMDAIGKMIGELMKGGGGGGDSGSGNSSYPDPSVTQYATKPTCSEFTAQSGTKPLKKGDSTKISWIIGGGKPESITVTPGVISQAVGQYDTAPDKADVTPEKTTTYTLKVKNRSGESTCKVKVFVGPSNGYSDVESGDNSEDGDSTSEEESTDDTSLENPLGDKDTTKDTGKNSDVKSGKNGTSGVGALNYDGFVGKYGQKEDLEGDPNAFLEDKDALKAEKNPFGTEDLQADEDFDKLANELGKDGVYSKEDMETLERAAREAEARAREKHAARVENMNNLTPDEVRSLWNRPRESVTGGIGEDILDTSNTPRKRDAGWFSNFSRWIKNTFCFWCSLEKITSLGSNRLTAEVPDATKTAPKTPKRPLPKKCDKKTTEAQKKCKDMKGDYLKKCMDENIMMAVESRKGWKGAGVGGASEEVIVVRCASKKEVKEKYGNCASECEKKGLSIFPSQYDPENKLKKCGDVAAGPGEAQGEFRAVCRDQYDGKPSEEVSPDCKKDNKNCSETEQDICKKNPSACKSGPATKDGPGQSGPGQTGPGQSGPGQSGPGGSPSGGGGGDPSKALGEIAKALAQQQQQPQNNNNNQNQKPWWWDELYGQNKPTEAPKCTEDSISASPKTIKKGETSTITWDVTGKGTIKTIINFVTTDEKGATEKGSLGVVDGGSVDVSPERSTTYTVKVANEIGTTVCTPSAKVFVKPADSEDDEEDTDTSTTKGKVDVSCEPDTIREGEQGTVVWSCPEKTEKSIGTSTEDGEFNTNGDTEGSADVSPLRDATYIVRCRDKFDKELGRSSCRIAVTPAGTNTGGTTSGIRPTVHISAEPPAAPKGTSVKVSWKSQNTASCVVYGPGCDTFGKDSPKCFKEVGRSGYVTGNLYETSQFRVECIAPDRKTRVSDSVTIEVSSDGGEEAAAEQTGDQ